MAAFVVGVRLIFSYLNPPLTLGEELDLVYDTLRQPYRQVIRSQDLRTYEDLMAKDEELEQAWDRARIKKVLVPPEYALISEEAYKGHKVRSRGDNRMVAIGPDEFGSRPNGKSPDKKETSSPKINK